MRQIYKIAKAELYTLFYSPIAWMILVIFAFQTAFVFSGVLQELVRYQELVDGIGAGTYGLFGGQLSLFPAVQGYLYLYATAHHGPHEPRAEQRFRETFVFLAAHFLADHLPGNSLAMMLFHSLVMIAMLVVYVLIGGIKIDNFSWQKHLPGCCLFYLLMCAYSAIGLWSQRLTGYQVVAVLGHTRAARPAERYRQSMAGYRIRARPHSLAVYLRPHRYDDQGLIGSEDVLYFRIIIGLFLGLAVLRLRAAARILLCIQYGENIRWRRAAALTLDISLPGRK